jgi:rubrerythrin
MKRIRKCVARARASEIQAIAIYEAEVFWIRRPERREPLLDILREERAHDLGLRPWSESGRFSDGLNRLAGWILGTILAGLPWPTLCRVQAWAEEEAARIYARALAELRLIREFPVDSALLECLAHARDQEREHASRFRALVGKTG